MSPRLNILVLVSLVFSLPLLDNSLWAQSEKDEFISFMDRYRNMTTYSVSMDMNLYKRPGSDEVISSLDGHIVKSGSSYFADYGSVEVMDNGHHYIYCEKQNKRMLVYKSDTATVSGIIQFDYNKVLENATGITKTKQNSQIVFTLNLPPQNPFQGIESMTFTFSGDSNLIKASFQYSQEITYDAYNHLYGKPLLIVEYYNFSSTLSKNTDIFSENHFYKTVDNRPKGVGKYASYSIKMLNKQP